MSHECPVCEYASEGENSLASVRAHIIASKRDGHDWGDLKAQVTGEEPSDDPEPSYPEPRTDEPLPDPELWDENDGTTDEGVDRATGEPDEVEPAKSETDETEMIDRDAEYAEQMDRAAGSPEDTGTPDANPGSDGGSSVFGALPDVSTTTIIAVVAIVVLVAVAYSMTSGGDDPEQDVSTIEDDDADQPTMLSAEDLE